MNRHHPQRPPPLVPVGRPPGHRGAGRTATSLRTGRSGSRRPTVGGRSSRSPPAVTPTPITAARISSTTPPTGTGRGRRQRKRILLNRQPIETIAACAAVSPGLSRAQLTAVRNADVDALRAARTPELRHGTFGRAILRSSSSVGLVSSMAFLMFMSAVGMDDGVRVSILMALMLLPVVGVGWTTYANRRRTRILAETSRGYILHGELTRDAATLLTRAQKAVHAVLKSTATHGVIDRQHAELALPDETWQIASALAEYSTHVMGAPQDVELDETLKPRLTSIELRVIALEDLATAAAHDDARHAHDARTLTQPDDSGILGFLADTARDEHAATWIRSLATLPPADRRP